MLKSLKKILPVLLALLLALAAVAGCSGNYTSGKLSGSTEGAVSSNGGFVVQKGDYVYFVNGAEDQSADNTYGSVVKGALMRISAADLAAGDYSQTETVVPLLLTSQDFTSGVYIYGDRVYYATPNVIKNMDGVVDSSYLDFKSSALDGSETMRDYYVQVSDNTTVYRYVQEPESGDVYLVYVDSADTEIRSYNTATGEETVLVKGYASYVMPREAEGTTIYYTMPVTQPYTYSAETGAGTQYGYQQLYCVSMFAEESPYTGTDAEGNTVSFTESAAYLAAYTDPDAAEDDDARVMEYINLGTLVLDGVGLNQDKATPFNHGWTDATASTSFRSLGGFTYSFLYYGDGALYLTVGKVREGSSFVYRFDEAAYEGASGWNAIASNPTIRENGSGTEDDSAAASTALTPVAISSSNATSSALYYTNEADETVYLYVDANGGIVRNTVNTATDADGTFTNTDLIGESVTLARGQSGAALLFTEGDYLYYSMSGTSGNGLYRIRYNGAAADYNIFEGAAADNDDYKPTRYLALEYNNTWYTPEVVTVGNAQYLFFGNAGTYAGKYVYVMDNPADNAALAALNERWEDVTAVMTDSDFSTRFATAADAAQYYFYSGDADLITLLTDEEEAYVDNYTEEELSLIRAFLDPLSEESKKTLSSYRLDFSALYEGDTLYNTESAFYAMLGQYSEEDEETIPESLAGAFLEATAEEDAEDTAWTWQWAAIFVPVGVVVIAAIVLAVVFLRKRRR